MRIATVLDDGRLSVAIVDGERILPLAAAGREVDSIRGIAASGPAALARIRDWVARHAEGAERPLDSVELGPAVPDPGAIFTVGLNYAPAAGVDASRPERPLVYAKLPSSVSGHGATLAWDRDLTPNVDAEVELAAVIGRAADGVTVEAALDHVFGYTIVNDVSSRDPWLDGDQWLLGKSMPGFCPVGPWIVTADEIDPHDLRLGCTINGVPIQDGTTARMRFSIAEVVSYLSRHVQLRPGDLVATGTPARLASPPGPDRHLQPGDLVTAWIEGVGELTTIIA